MDKIKKPFQFEITPVLALSKAKHIKDFFGITGEQITDSDLQIVSKKLNEISGNLENANAVVTYLPSDGVWHTRTMKDSQIRIDAESNIIYSNYIVGDKFSDGIFISLSKFDSEKNGKNFVTIKYHYQVVTYDSSDFHELFEFPLIDKSNWSLAVEDQIKLFSFKNLVENVDHTFDPLGKQPYVHPESKVVVYF